MMIACVNPISLALLRPPGEWGEHGADIVCGEGQPLGSPLASGGPYFGFLTCKQAFVRQLPGRLVGRTVDANGKEGFTLTLQAREQHIRRSKARSNICTNQGLLVTAATIYMSAMGDEGLQSVAKTCHSNAAILLKKLLAIDGVTNHSNKPFFHEFVIKLPVNTEQVLKVMHGYGIEAGLSLKPYFPELMNCLLVCVTETKTLEDINQYASLMQTAIDEVRFYNMETKILADRNEFSSIEKTTADEAP
jgi:glycine dehydrogenase subunit 1